MKLLTFALAATLGAAMTPANAVTLQYTLSGNDLDGTVEYASFQVDSNPVILPNNISVGNGFRVKFLSGIFQYGTQITTVSDIQFFNTTNLGGFANVDPADTNGTSTFLIFDGPQLYSGSEASPTLLTGSFTLHDSYSGAPIALTVAAVPEPAAWTLMIAGFGAVGGAMRRRAPTRAVAVHA